MAGALGTGTSAPIGADAGSSGRRTPPKSLVGLLVVAALVVFVVAVMAMRPPTVRLLAWAAHGNGRTACVLGWFALGFPLWTALAGRGVLRAYGRAKAPRWLIGLWSLTFLVTVAVMPPKRRSLTDYESEMAPYAGRLTHAMQVGVSAALVPLVMLPLLAWAMAGLASKLDRGRSMTDAAFFGLLYGLIAGLQVASLALVQAVGDLAPRAVDTRPSGDARSLLDLPPYVPGPRFAGRPAPHAYDLAPLPEFQLGSTGWTRLAAEDSAGCAAAGGPPVAALLAEAGCRRTARVLLADPAHDVIAAVSAVELSSASEALDLHRAHGFDLPAAPLELPAARRSALSAGLREAYEDLRRGDPGRRSASDVADATVYLTTIARAGGPNRPLVRDTLLSEVGFDLLGLPTAYAGYLAVPAKFPPGQIRPATPTAAQLFPRNAVTLSELGTWRKVAAVERPACTGAVRDPELSRALAAARCRRTAWVLLADAKRGLLATVTVLQVDGAERVEPRYGLSAPPVVPPPRPAGLPAALAGAYARLVDHDRHPLYVTGSTYARGSTLALWAVAPADGETPTSPADAELFRLFSSYLQDQR